MSLLETERIDGCPVVRIREDIDAANAAIVQQQLAAAIEGASSLVVDLSETGYLDSAGIDMLLRLSVLLDNRRAKLILVIPASSQIRRLAEIVGLPNALPVYEGISEALQSVLPRRTSVVVPDGTGSSEA